MPYYLALEDYLEPSNRLKVKGLYATESTIPTNRANERLTVLMEESLKVAYLEAEALKIGGSKRKDPRQLENLSIRERANFFEENSQQKLMAEQRRLNEIVIHNRKILRLRLIRFLGS